MAKCVLGVAMSDHCEAMTSKIGTLSYFKRLLRHVAETSRLRPVHRHDAPSVVGDWADCARTIPPGRRLQQKWVGRWTTRLTRWFIWLKDDLDKMRGVTKSCLK